MQNVQLLLLPLGRPEELPEGMILIPGHEGQLPRLRMQVDVVVLPLLQEAVGIRDPDQHCQIPRERVEIDKLAQTRGERLVARARDQIAEVHDALLVGRREIGLRMVHVCR